MNPKVVVITGPTASGKTSLVVALSKRFPLEVINADGLQVFRHMDIGTAKPSKRIQEAVPHHLIDVLNPDEPVSAAWYAAHAKKAVETVIARKKIPVCVGGSGFYLRALERPPLASGTIDPGAGESVLGETGDGEELARAYQKLQSKDPTAAAKIHPNDQYRITRGLHLIRKGILPSHEAKIVENQPPTFDLVFLGLQWERAALHERIKERTEEMFDRGLAGETKNILRDFPNSRTRLERAIGYRQALMLLEGKVTEGDARRLALEATRQYAKRQITWFRKETRIEWLDAEKGEDVFDRACDLMAKVNS